MIKKLMFFVFLSSIYNNNYSATSAAPLSKYTSKKWVKDLAIGSVITSGITAVLYYNNADFNQLKELTFQSFDFCKDKVVDFSKACPVVPAAVTGFLLLKRGSRFVSTYTLPSALILACIYFNTYEEFEKAITNNNPNILMKNFYDGGRNLLINSTNSMVNFFKGKNKPETNNTSNIQPKPKNNRIKEQSNTLDNIKDFLITYKYHILTGLAGLTLLTIFIKKAFSSNNSAPWSTLNKS
jgi:hypothetical protein